MGTIPQETADLVTFTEDFMMGNFIFVQCAFYQWPHSKFSFINHHQKEILNVM